MPPAIDSNIPPRAEPVEFSIEDALLNTWVDENTVYLQLDTDEIDDSDDWSQR